MAITIHAVKKFSALRANDPQSEEALSEIRDGEIVRLQITRASKRSVQHHRLFFSLMGIVSDHMGWTTDQALTWVKTAVGHTDPVYDRNGKVTFVPRSVSFSKMDQHTFNDFFNRAVMAILDRLLPPGTPRADLVAEIHERIGESRP